MATQSARNAERSPSEYLHVGGRGQRHGSGRECPTSSTICRGRISGSLDEYSDKLIAAGQNHSRIGRFGQFAAIRQARSAIWISIGRGLPTSAFRCRSIQQALNTLVAGQTASTFNAGDDQYDVVVQAEDRFRGSVEGLEKLTVASTKAGSVGLNEVVRTRTSSGPSSIERLNRQRIVEVTGNLLPGGSQSTAVNSFERFIGRAEHGAGL